MRLKSYSITSISIIQGTPREGCTVVTPLLCVRARARARVRVCVCVCVCV